MVRVAIIGAGISGLSAAFAIEEGAKKAGISIETLVLEKEERCGGKIQTVKEDGFLCEWGPNGFLDNKPMTLELCAKLGVSSSLLRSNDNARKRFIYSEGRLHQLPENGPAFLKSQLISWPGKLRLACELLVPPRHAASDETLADFGRRRLGSEALDKLIAPMVAGIFAGDPETMSLKSCFPRIHELERDFGGLLKAMILLARKKRAEVKAGKVVASAAGPGGVLTSFNGGIQELAEGARSALAGQVKTGSGVKEVRNKDGRFELTLEGGEIVEADIVVSAAPSHALSSMVAPLDSGLKTSLEQIPYASMNVVCFGYEREKIAHDLNGFGYLIPRREGRSTLGTLWDSSIFPNRAPEGQVLLRSMMGGATNPAAFDLSESEVVRRVKEDLRRIMGISAEPDFARVFRHRRAIPQYTTGHGSRLLALNEQISKYPGFYLTGNAFSGVGLNDCVHASNQVAEKVLAFIKSRN